MATTNLPPDALKQALKEALSETLSEQRDLFRDIFEEVLEDFALAEAIRKGQETERVGRDEIFDMLEGEK
jgi:DNA gyrase/topoisomerase IV subunit B